MTECSVLHRTALLCLEDLDYLCQKITTDSDSPGKIFIYTYACRIPNRTMHLQTSLCSLAANIVTGVSSLRAGKYSKLLESNIIEKAQWVRVIC